MTDDASAHDSIDDRKPKRTLRRRGFLTKVAATGIAGLTGLSALSGSAAANAGEIFVRGGADGHHQYEIHLEPGGTIQREDAANAHDVIETSSWGGDHQVVRGHVWNHNTDKFSYTGEIDRVEIDGDLYVGFGGSGAWLEDWEDHGHLYVDGLSSGRHEYSLWTASGNIDSYEDESGDVEASGPASERPDTDDLVEGVVWNQNRDRWSLEDGPVTYVQADGHVRIQVRFQS